MRFSYKLFQLSCSVHSRVNYDYSTKGLNDLVSVATSAIPALVHDDAIHRLVPVAT